MDAGERGREMLLQEILIDSLFAAAVLSAVGCLTYLVYATLLERHLLRSRRTSVRPKAAGATAAAASTPVAAALVATPDRWRRGVGTPALPGGRS